jgi:dTDP-4-amino-4,6-dideoxygalactose transaminase
VNDLLKQGGSLSAYRANKDYGVEPVKDSYAWRLEREIEKRFKVKHAVAVNSGTAGLHCGLQSLDLRGGEVITSPYTFSATVSAILLAGGTPVFADVDPYTFCITKETVKRVITKRTKAIVPVSLFGYRPDYRDMGTLNLPIVEDGCQAVGASQRGEFLQQVCQSQAMSFNGSKNIPAGECGALVTNSDRVCESARLLANHGENFGVNQIGLNYRPNELTCCVAYHGLLELEERNERRQELATGIYDYLVSVNRDKFDALISVHLPAPYPKYPDHVYYVYPLRLSEYCNVSRPLFIQRMKRHGIHVGAGYITPHLGKYKAFRKYARGPLPVVEELSSKTLCLLYDMTPDKPLSYAVHVADCMRKSLCE